MADYSYIPKRVCAKQIFFSIEDGKLKNIRFVGGCNGNLKAIGKLLEGSSAEDTVRILKGNDCSGRGTSCADQLAIAVEKALAESK